MLFEVLVQESIWPLLPRHSLLGKAYSLIMLKHTAILPDEDAAHPPRLPLYSEFLQSSADLEVVVDSTVLLCHCRVLAAESKVFADMLDSIAGGNGGNGVRAPSSTHTLVFRMSAMSARSKAHGSSVVYTVSAHSPSAGSVMRIEEPFKHVPLADMKALLDATYMCVFCHIRDLTCSAPGAGLLFSEHSQCWRSHEERHGAFCDFLTGRACRPSAQTLRRRASCWISRTVLTCRR